MDERVRQLVALALDPKGKWFGVAPQQVGESIVAADDVETAGAHPSDEAEPEPDEERPAWDEWDPA